MCATAVLTGCTTATDQDGRATDGRVDAARYPAEMAEICDATRLSIEALPSPPDRIRRVDWAREVARLLSSQAASFAALAVSGDLAEDHRSLTANAERTAGEWATIADALERDDAEAISAATTEIGALTLGRDDLLDEMGVDACRGGVDAG